MAVSSLGNSPGMLQSRAYEYIKRKILNDDMEVGVYYSETKLAQELNISRTPIRQALHCLSQDGYITIAPSRGFTLRQLTRLDVRETLETRCAIEGFCTYRLGIQTDEKRRRFFLDINDALDSMQDAIDAKDMKRFINYDHQFHLAIVKSARNHEFDQIFQRLMYLIHLTTKSAIEIPGRLEETVQEHVSYVNLLKNRETTEAYHLMMKHLMMPIELLSDNFPDEEDMPW